MKKTLLALFLSFQFIHTAISQQSPELDKLDQYFEKMVKDWDVPSASIGIVKDGELIFTGNYGTKETGKSDKPDENTLYAIASNSKAFTASLLGILVQEDKLNWNDRVKDHLPYFSLFDDPWISSQVTIRDLLSHRVGLGTFSGDVIWYKNEGSAEDFIRRAGKLPQAYDFRSGYGYSNLMYITAGEIIQKVTGKSWGENVKERILQPLGMDRTLTTAKALENTDNVATPHGREDEKNFPIAFEDWETIAATGGLISSVKDISKWMIFNMDHGILGQDTLLTKQTRNMVWTLHNVFPVDHTVKNDLGRHFSGYGLGWTIGDFHGKMMVGHTGGYDGMITAVTMIPDEKLGVVVLTNGHQSPIMAATYYALDRFLGTGDKDWSSDMLKRRSENEKEDKRVADIKKTRISGTKASVAKDKLVGKYQSDIYGLIEVKYENEKLRLYFEDAPRLSASLEHWHFDTYEIKWDEKHAWFDFGTLQFLINNKLEVHGMEFNVPNDDIFFEELKPKKIK
ncbi:serine hydrolase [Arthrospiribacter ruber]|uniref:Serine hydrolase n=1 Tax=Arthrospiribacter ruber TaxID=2487934 RepID=A0A951IYV0_9BACT|nr:serine hydrolase [Arthrospiribacter ruber]MBW3468952.1 serine hydrolase [Arthrospiribacter ruber]